MSSSEPLEPIGQRATRVRFLVLGWLCAAAAIAYLQRSCLGVLDSTIRKDLDITKDEMGWVMGNFLLTYAIFQIPSGWLADRWGSRVTLPFYCVLWSLATSATALAGWFALPDNPGGQVALASAAGAGWLAARGSVLWLAGTRLAGGAAQAGVFPCCAIVLGTWFPATNRGFATGWVAASQQVGAVTATLLAGFLLTYVPWTWIFVLYSLPGFVWAAAFYVWFRDRPDAHPVPNAAELALIAADRPLESGQPRDATPWLALISSPVLWWICLQQFCRAFAYIFYSTWFPTYLQETRHVSVAASGYYTSLPLIATLCGGLVSGAFSDWLLHRTGSRRIARQGVAALSLLLCAVCFGFAYSVADPNRAVAIISLGSFWAAVAGTASYTLTIEMAGKHVATVFAVMNMSGNVGAWIFPILVPRLLKLPGGWDLVMTVVGGAYVIATLCWLFVNPNGSVFDRSLLGRVRDDE